MSEQLEDSFQESGGSIMTDLKPLMSLLSQAEQARDRAIAAHSEAINHLEALKQQSHQLLEYRQEYEQRWTGQFKSQGGIEVLRYYQSFTERINQALTHQQRTQTQVEQHLQARQAELIESEMKVASIKKLIERRMSEHARQSGRQEQKITDEMAARTLMMAPKALPNSIV